jgi:hypothetical protein
MFGALVLYWLRHLVYYGMVWSGTHFRNCILQTGLRQLLRLHLGVKAKLVVLGFGLVDMLVHIAIHGFGIGCLVWFMSCWIVSFVVSC